MYGLLLGYVLLAGVVFWLGVVRSVRQGRSHGLMLISVAFCLFYCVFPVLLVLFGGGVTRQLYVYHRFGVGDYSTMMALALTFGACWTGYVSRDKYATSGGTGWVSLKGGEEAVFLRYFAYVLVGLGLIGLTYQAVQAGGIFAMLELSSCIRGNSCGMDGEFVFLRQLNYFVATGFMAYLAAFFQDDVSGKRSLTIALYVIVGLFVYQAASTAGRRDILYPLVICFSMFYFAGYRKKTGYLVLLGAGGSWWWLTLINSSAYLDAAASSDMQSSANNLEVAGRYVKNATLDIVRAIGDSFMHFVALQHVETGRFGFLRDWIELPLEFMPTRLLGIERGRGVVGEISSYMLGRELSPDFSGEEPAGLHGYALVNFGYNGAIFFFFFFGWFLCWIDEKLHPRSQGTPVKWLAYLLGMWLLLEYMREGSIALIFKPRISWIVLIVFVVWINQMSIFQKRIVE